MHTETASCALNPASTPFCDAADGEQQGAAQWTLESSTTPPTVVEMPLKRDTYSGCSTVSRLE